MAWYSAIIEELDEHLGVAQKRFLSAVLEIASATDENELKYVASKKAVIKHLSKQENSPPSEAALRKRIQLINIAASQLNCTEADESTFAIHSRTSVYEVAFSASLKKRLVHRKAIDQVIQSTQEDTNIEADDFEEPYVTSDIPHFQVFISHAHENEQIEETVKSFAQRLAEKLANLPHRYKNKFTVSCWIDHFDMRGVKPFEGQTDPACEESELAIFLLNDRWYNSGACKREASFFHNPDAADHPRYLRIQLSGKRADGDPEYVNGQCFPEGWRTNEKTLLSVWNLTEACKDEFVTHIREEICIYIDGKHFSKSKLKSKSATKETAKRTGVSASGSPKNTPFKTATVFNELMNHERLEREVQEGKTISPKFTLKEGGDKTDKAIPILIDWACNKKSSNRVYALLGSFGAGKTTASQLFAQELIEKRKTDAKVPYPVYLDFRRLKDIYGRDTKTPPTLAEIVRQCLHSDVRDTIDKDQLLQSLRTEPCVIIFDGLDEIGTRIGTERAAALYRDLLEIVPKKAWNSDRAEGKADWSLCPTHILVTCRTHFFRDHVEQESVLCENDRFSGLNIKEGSEPVKTVYMAPFDIDQIKSFFLKILGDELGLSAFESIRNIHDLRGLAKKPIMARYIAELAPDLIADKEAGRVINVARVYEHLFRRALARDQDKRPLLQPSDRQVLLEDLALHMWQCRTLSLTTDQLGKWFDDYAVDNAGIKMILTAGLDARGLLHTQLRNASLLVRENEDEFRFVHTSFYEYFLAIKLLELLLNGNIVVLTEFPAPSKETYDFIVYLTALSSGWGALHDACDRLIMPGNSRSNRDFILNLREALFRADKFRSLPEGADLSDLDLRQVHFSMADRYTLKDVSFARANMHDKEWEGVSFKNCKFEGANLSNNLFSECSFKNCLGKPRHVRGTRTYDSHFDKKQFAFQESLQFSPITHEFLLETLPETLELNVSQLSLITFAVFSPDGETVLTGSHDSTVQIWDVKTAAEITCFKGHSGAVTSAVFSPDGKTVLTGSYDGTALIWDVKTAAEITRIKGHQGPLSSAVFSPDGKTVLTGSRMGTSVFNLERGEFDYNYISFTDSWAVLDINKHVRSFGPNAWKYIHGVKTDSDGTRKIVNPFHHE